MTYSFHPEAEREFIRAIDYYEERQQELGYEFSIEVHSAIQRVLSFPELWPFIEEKIRRSLVKRYPYGIFDEIEDHVFIVAIMHLHREPGYWKHRQ